MSYQELLLKLIGSTQGEGPSSTKLVYLTNGMLAAYCATLGTVAIISVYIWFRVVDPIICGFVSALWVTSIGFASGAKKHAAEMTKEITTNAKIEDSK